MKTERFFLSLLLVLSLSSGQDALAQSRQPEYQLGQGDNIRIVVYQNPDLTVETRVTENGTITYPLVGTVVVGGMTIPAAERTVAKALNDGGFIQKPQVNINLLQNRGNQVSVLGAVNRAGRFPLETATTHLSEMIAIAGGIAPNGGDLAVLVGTRDGKPYRKSVDIADMFTDERPRDDIVVVGGDVIYVYRMPVFYVYGEVQKPGSSRVERGMTFRQALAESGGPTVRGTESRLRLYRRTGDGKVESSSPDLNDTVRADDVLYVNQSLF